MYHRILLFFLGITLSLSSVAQVEPLSKAQQSIQRTYILHDSLPVFITPLPTTINTHFSEYSGQLLPDSSFYFTSMRADVDEDFDQFFETSWYCNIYLSKLLPNGQYLPPVSLPKTINARNYFNSNFFINTAQNQIIFSRCTKDSYGELQCALWQSTWDGKNWGRAQRLPDAINQANSSNMQPFLTSYDDHDILFFVSNRASGFGGYDIWYSVVKGDNYYEPINLGSTINTEGNEITPFYDKENGILYFSSDEHTNIGGYDIFFSEGAFNQWGEVSNMGVPFNSEYNDYYFTFGTNNSHGFLSSNRPHNNTSPSDTCCNDLFYFQWDSAPTDTILAIETPSIQEKIASLLPITLYFQNDQPNPKSISDTTAFDYFTLYQQYMSEHTLYIQESGRGLSGSTHQRVTQEMVQFMQDSVAAGYQRLLQLEQYLKEALQQGDSIALTIRGYASPLHHSTYNKHLSMRRITSLLNYLRTTENGFFRSYLDHPRSLLKMYLEPQGAVNHSFETNETRETIYGLQAAKDRKIIITL